MLADVTLSEFEIDAITETMNVGIGRAANVLSSLVAKPINLTIPRICLVELETVRRYLDQHYETWGSCVILPFDGGLKGDGVLVFSASSAAGVINIVGEVHLDANSPLITEMEADLLMEVGNIIINGCVGSIANLVGASTTDGLPKFFSRGHGTVFEELLEKDKSNTFGMIITTTLRVHEAEVSTDLIITFEKDCMQFLLGQLSQLVES